MYKYIGPPIQVIAYESFEQMINDRNFRFKAFLLNSNCKLIAEVNNDLATIQKVAILDGAFHDIEPIKVAVEYLQNEQL